VNVISHYWLLKECLPSMITHNHGHVVTVASAAGWVGIPGQTDYSASKWAATGLAEALRLELKHMGATGVKTTCVCPYFIDTGMFDGVAASWLPILPILKPDNVVEQMMTAIRRDTPVLNMPWFVISMTPLLRSLLPVDAFDWVVEFIGVANSMDTFAGRSIDVPAAASAAHAAASSS
jgi:all-trans-retinol dehydrogenase (NAD+)